MIAEDLKKKNEGEKQLRATLAILTGLSYCYEREKILSTNLRKRLEVLGIVSLQNLPTNLVKYHQFVLPRGKSGIPKFSYKITVSGKKEGLKLIREFVQNNKAGA